MSGNDTQNLHNQIARLQEDVGLLGGKVGDWQKLARVLSELARQLGGAQLDPEDAARRLTVVLQGQSPDCPPDIADTLERERDAHAETSERDSLRRQTIGVAQRYVQWGKFAKAIATYQAFLTDHPDDIRILLKMGDLQQQHGDGAAAKETYVRVAAYYETQGFYLKAVAVFKQVIKLDPNDTQLRLKLAHLYEQLDLMRDALSELRAVAKEFRRTGRDGDESIVLSRITTIDPRDTASRIWLAEAYVRKDLRAPAVAEFTCAARDLREQRRMDEWSAVTERLLTLDPMNTRVARELGKHYLNRGEHLRAKEKLLLRYSTDPEETDTIENLAQCCIHLGDFDRATLLFTKLVELYRRDGNTTMEQLARAWLTTLDQDGASHVRAQADVDALAIAMVGTIMDAMHDTEDAANYPRLRVLGGPDEGDALVIRDETAYHIGNQEDCHLRLRGFFGRFRAVVQRDAKGGVSLSVLDQQAEAFVNDLPLSSNQRVELCDRDIIQIGATQVVFVDPEADIMDPLKDLPDDLIVRTPDAGGGAVGASDEQQRLFRAVGTFLEGDQIDVAYALAAKLAHEEDLAEKNLPTIVELIEQRRDHEHTLTLAQWCVRHGGVEHVLEYFMRRFAASVQLRDRASGIRQETPQSEVERIFLDECIRRIPLTDEQLGRIDRLARELHFADWQLVMLSAMIEDAKIRTSDAE
ncbi:MAG: tetratricopeptide repeat protein [bacterium]|nr:tetratricopeptide repeat protein [bacterium]